MVSNEWWIYHLTENGWVDGSYKHDFEKEVIIEVPPQSVFTRKYYEKLGHPKASINAGYDDLTGKTEFVEELLKKYPHPTQFSHHK